MGQAKITLRDDDAAWKALQRELAKLDGAAIQVGIQPTEDESLRQFAAIEEFGSPGWTISGEQAQYIARHLMGLDPTTEPGAYAAKVAELTGQTVKIPERSFIRAGVDANQGRIAAAVDQAIGRVAAGEADTASQLQALGDLVEHLIQDYAAKTLRSGNASLADDVLHTVDPLVGTNQLIASIKSVIDQRR